MYKYNEIEFFDAMNLLKSEKKERIELSQQIKEKVQAFFKSQFADILSGAFLHTKLSADYIDSLMDLYLFSVVFADPDLQTESEVIDRAYQFGEYVEGTTEKTYLTAKGNGRFELSRQIGTKLLQEDVPDFVKRLFSDERALTISLNESNWIYNYIRHNDLIKSGQLTHSWETMKDERVRITHREADGQTVPINEPFIVGGYKLRFPGDGSLGAPISETILCRCIEI